MAPGKSGSDRIGDVDARIARDLDAARWWSRRSCAAAADRREFVLTFRLFARMVIARTDVETPARSISSARSPRSNVDVVALRCCRRPCTGRRSVHRDPPQSTRRMPILRFGGQDEEGDEHTKRSHRPP
jgi:hypothetical protein